MSKKKAVTAPNPTVRYSKVTVDGVEYSLIFNFNAIAIAEETAGTNLLKALDNLSDLSVIQFRGLLFAAMLKAQPDITVEQVGDLLRPDTIPLLTSALAQAYINSIPKPKEKAENPPTPDSPAK